MTEVGVTEPIHISEPSVTQVKETEDQKKEKDKQRLNEMNKKLMAHFGIDYKTLSGTEVTEAAVLRYCVSQGATTLTEQDIQGVAGKANFCISGVYLPRFFGDTLFINYKSLTLEQRKEVRDLIRKLGVESFILEDFEKDVAKNFGAYVTGHFDGFRDLVFIKVDGFLDTLVPLLKKE